VVQLIKCVSKDIYKVLNLSQLDAVLLKVSQAPNQHIGTNTKG